MNKKEHFCSLEGLRNCHGHVPVPSPMSAYPTVFCETPATLHSSGACVPLLFFIVRSCTWASACFGLALVSLCRQLLSTWAWIPRVLCSVILPLRIVSGLFSPHPQPLFLPYILCQCYRCPSPLQHGGSWLACQDLPAMGAVSSRSWQSIVQAPGCLGHSTST